MTTKLEDLAGKLNERIGRDIFLSVAHKDFSLDLNLDLKQGFEGNENVNIAQRADLYDLTYFGIFSQAFKTFLDERYERKIRESEILSRFKDRVAEVKRKGEVEVYDKKRDEIYSRLLNTTEKGFKYNEIEKAVFFFADVFKEKAESPDHKSVIG